MKTLQEVLEAYENADQIRRHNMWYRFVALRDAFDEIERYGKSWDMETRPWATLPMLAEKGGEIANVRIHWSHGYPEVARQIKLQGLR